MIKFGSPRILAIAAIALSAVSRVCESRVADREASVDVHLDAPNHEQEHGHAGNAPLQNVHADEQNNVVDHDMPHDVCAIDVIGPEEILQSLEDRNAVLFEFYAPWCRYCINSKGELDKAAAQLASKEIKVYKINCDEAGNKAYCEKMKVEGFPTLKFAFKIGDTIIYKDYKKAITEEGVVDFVNHYDDFTPKFFIGRADFDKLPSTTIPVVFSVAKGDDPTPLVKLVLAHLDDSTQMDHISVGIMDAHSMTDDLKDHKESSLKIYRGGSTLPPVTYTGKLDLDHISDIIEFISIVTVPIIAKFEQKDSSRYGLPNSRLVYGLYETEEQNDKLFALFNAAYEARPNTLAVRTFPAADYQVIANFFGFNPKESELPCIALRDTKTSLNYLFKGGYFAEDILQFDHDITHGLIQPYVRNEKDVPESTGLVKNVNSQMFHQLLMDNPESISYVAVFTHPSYPEMEKSIPILEEVANKVSNHPKLQFVAMNLSMNDVHPEITDKFGSELVHINLFIEGKHFKPLTSMEVTEYHICELLAEHLKLTNPYPKPAIDHKATIQDLMSETSDYEDDLPSLSEEVANVAAGDAATDSGIDESSSHSEEEVL
jgi:thiol-disulfide isomerase/thioredoxin